MNTFISKLQQSLLENNKKFISSNVQAIANNQDNYLSMAFVYSLYEYPKTNFDLSYAVDKINNISSTSNIFDLSNNRIYFQVVDPVSVDYLQLLHYHNEILPQVIEYKLNEYKRINSKVGEFNLLKEFRMFYEAEFENSKVAKILAYKSLLLDPDNWCSYCFKLFSLFFHEFEYNQKLSRNGYKRFSKPINHNFFLVLEYSEKGLRNEIKNGFPELPEINISVMNIDNGEKPEFIFIGSADNNFININYLKPSNFFSKYQMTKISDNEYNITNFIKKIPLENGKTKLYVDFPYENELKFQAYCYYDIYSFFSKLYINYIENCAKSIMLSNL